jgi:hypothetical protein
MASRPSVENAGQAPVDRSPGVFWGMPVDGVDGPLLLWFINSTAQMPRISALFVLGLGIAAVAPVEKAMANSAVLDSTAITESTEAGRQVAVPTAEHPAYVVIHSGGRHDFGKAMVAKGALSSEILEQRIESALASAHYLRTDASHPASLLIVFSWGIHAALDGTDPGYGNLLDRAALAGGSAFASDLKKVLSLNERTREITPTTGLPGASPVANVFQIARPLEVFRRRDQQTENLLVQISNDCYYVVISAFDYASTGQGKRQLLWRTKLTAAAPGLSMADAIFSLIAKGSSYHGRNMNEAAFFSNR